MEMPFARAKPLATLLEGLPLWQETAAPAVAGDIRRGEVRARRSLRIRGSGSCWEGLAGPNTGGVEPLTHHPPCGTGKFEMGKTHPIASQPTVTCTGDAPRAGAPHGM